VVIYFGESVRRKMEFAIYALAIVGPAVMGVGGVFATWNKTVGLWIGFLGAVLLVLSLALYLQNDILKQLSEPIVYMKPPPERFVLRWEKGKYAAFTRLQDRAPDVGQGLYPTMQLVNTSPVNALDASIRWQIAPYDYRGLLQQSPRFEHIKVDYEENQVVFTGDNILAQGMRFATSSTTSINYITRKADAFIPGPVWEYAALFVLATLPEQQGGTTAPLTFDATLTWNIPEGSPPRHFRIKMIATNAKLPSVTVPDLLATLDFEIEDLDAPK
jgi:hypothetical protein